MTWPSKEVGEIITALRRIGDGIAALASPPSDAVRRATPLDDPSRAVSPVERVQTWAKVEMLGHRTLFGFIEEVETLTGPKVRLTVPECQVEAERASRIVGTETWERRPAYTVPAWSMWIGPGAIYAVTHLADQESVEALRFLAGRVSVPPGFVPPDREPCEADVEGVDPLDQEAEIPW